MITILIVKEHLFVATVEVDYLASNAVDIDQTTLINYAPKIFSAMKARVDVTKILIVRAHLSAAAAIIVPSEKTIWTVAQSHVTMTLIALIVENVMIFASNVGLTQTLLIGQSAARIHHVLMGKVIVITILTVKDLPFVAITIVARVE